MRHFEGRGKKGSRRYRRRRCVEIATFTKAAARPLSIPSNRVTCRTRLPTRTRVRARYRPLLERATLYLDKRRVKGGRGGDKQAARYRNSTRNDDLSPLIETGLTLVAKCSKRVKSVIIRESSTIYLSIHSLVRIVSRKDKKIVQSLINVCDSASCVNSPEIRII